MKNKTLFVSADHPEGYTMPQSTLISVDLLNGSISFKTDAFLYYYSFNSTILSMTNIKTHEREIIKLNEASLEEKKEFEKKLLRDADLKQIEPTVKDITNINKL